MPHANEANRELLRHAVATVAYRGGKALRGAPESFGIFQTEGARTPSKLLAHIGDLFDWALSIARGQQVWRDSEPLAWHAEVERFFRTLQNFDEYLASGSELHAPVEKLLQAPIADALTHIGQIAMLRRMAGVPIKSENYFKAEIVAGRCGAEQTPAKREFD